jgi:hypothetical protein
MPTLVENPFYLLGASPGDNRRRIIELAEEKSLGLDAQACMQARADLTNPRNRLAAEIAWLPGMEPGMIGKLTLALDSSPVQAVEKLGNAVPPLSLANLLAYVMERIKPETDLGEWKKLLIQFAEAAEKIAPGDVADIINKDRAEGGFPAVSSLEAVEAEIVERRRYYKQAAKDAINRLPTLRLVKIMTDAVETATRAGSRHAPLLISDLLDGYELEAQTFLQREGDNAKRLVDLILECAPKGGAAVNPWLDRLERVLRNWGQVARPIQMMMKTRGLSHAMSNELFKLVRSMGIYLFNEHQLVDAEARLLGVLQQVFDVSPEVAEVLAGDLAYMKRVGVSVGRPARPAPLRP